MFFRCSHLLLVTLIIGLVGTSAPSANQGTLTKEEMAQFLRTAEVINSRRSEIGVTRPWVLTLSDGRITHDAGFNSVDEHEALKEFRDGTREVNFIDSYKYNLAAYRLAELLGLDHRIPVTVERTWRGTTGSLSWYIDNVMFDERTRLAQEVRAPDVGAWNRQLFNMRVFWQLIDNTDTNLTNLLIDRNWTCWMIDFTRAFRRRKELQSTSDLGRIDRTVFENLQRLSMDAVSQATKPYLTDAEIEALMARRDLMVEHFQTLIATKGERVVLY